MKIDIRNTSTIVDCVQFADEKDNFYSKKDSMDNDYATEVESSGYAGHNSISFNQPSFLIKDWKAIKEAVDLLISEMDK